MKPIEMYLDKNALEPFRGMKTTKNASALVEAEDVKTLREEVTRYIEATRPLLSQYVVDVNFDNVDFENGDVIGKITCDVEGNEVKLPIIIKERMINPIDVGEYNGELIPTFDEYLEKFVDPQTTEVESAVKKDPETGDDIASVFRFENETELPTYKKASAIRKMAEDMGIAFGTETDAYIYNDKYVRRPKIARVIVGDGRHDYHHDVKALLMDKNGEMQIEIKQDLPAEDVEKLKRLPTVKFGNLLGPCPGVEACSAPETAKKLPIVTDEGLPEGMQYLASAIKQKREFDSEQINALREIKAEYKDLWARDTSLVEELTDAVYDTDLVSCIGVEGRVDDNGMPASFNTDSDRYNSKERYIMVLGKLTIVSTKSEVNDRQLRRLPNIGEHRDSDRSKAYNYPYVVYVYLNEEGIPVASMPYKVMARYSLAIPGKNMSVMVNKLQRYVTGDNVCFIEGLGSPKMVSLSQQKLQEIGLYEGDSSQYFALPEAYTPQGLDDVRYIMSDIRPNLLDEPAPEDKDVVKVAVTENGSRDTLITVKGAGYNCEHSGLSKEDASMYLSYYTGTDITPQEVKVATYTVEPDKVKKPVTVNNAWRGEWLKAAKYLQESMEKKADISRMVDAMVGMEYITDEIDTSEEYIQSIMYEIPKMINSIGKLLIQARLERNNISPSVLSRVFEALGRLHCEIA